MEGLGYKIIYLRNLSLPKSLFPNSYFGIQTIFNDTGGNLINLHQD